MNVKQIRYIRRMSVKDAKENYVTEEAELTADVTPSEDHVKALEELKLKTLEFFKQQPKQEKPAEPKPIAKPSVPAITVSRVNEALGEDANLVVVSLDSAGLITVKPREFLGKEKFSEIAAKLKAFDAQYVSAQKDSRFKIKP